MYISKTNRKVLFDLIKKRDPYDILEIISSNKIDFHDINQDELIFIWFKKPTIGNYLPELIVVAENKLRDFLAWASTYVSSFTPFTAFCRVLSPSLAKKFLSSNKINSIDNIEGACIGLILGETLSHFFNNNIKNISPLAIKSSLSFILIKSLLLGINEYSDIIANRWVKACILTKTDKRVLSSEIIINIWETLILLNGTKYSKKVSLTDQQKLLSEACNNIAKNGSIDRKLWLKLINNIDELKNANEQIKTNIEDRVSNFENFSNLLSNHKIIDKKIAEFLCAYLASQIEPGSMNHINLIRPYMNIFPSVIIWYSICSGLYQNTNLYNFENSLGWRIIRDLYLWLPDIGKPKCDISIDELEVMVDVDNPNLNFRIENPTSIFIEIVPSIYSVFIWRDFSKKKKTDQPEAKIKEDPVVELGELLEKANQLYKRYFRKNGSSHRK